jgi:hypothetical protein
MKGNMQILQNSIYTRTKKLDPRKTVKLRAYIVEKIKQTPLIKVEQIQIELNCRPEKAEAVLKEVKERKAALKKLQEANLDKVTKRVQGYIYLVEHELYVGWIKCGMTEDVLSRLGAYNGYDPMKRFKVICSKLVLHRRKAESQLLNDIKMRSTLQSGEWFKISKEDAMQIFDSI